MNKYYKFITKKNKNESKELSSKVYTKLDNKEKNKKEMFNIPKNQRIVNLKQIRNLNLFNQYIIINFIIIIITIALYIFLLLTWLKYFKIKENLYSYIDKNSRLENSVFKSINIYYIMIFNNFTISEVNKNIYSNIYDPKDPLLLLNSFYKDLQLIYNIDKEKENLYNLYDCFETKSDFSCKVLYKKNDDFFDEIDETE